jgi:hypothetical protein
MLTIRLSWMGRATTPAFVVLVSTSTKMSLSVRCSRPAASVPKASAIGRFRSTTAATRA